MPDENQPVVVFESADLNEMRMAQNLLQAAEIPCRVNSGGNASLLGAVLGSQFAGFHQLLVPAEIAPRAEEVLEAAWLDRAPEEPD